MPPLVCFFLLAAQRVYMYSELYGINDSGAFPAPKAGGIYDGRGSAPGGGI